MRIFHTIIHLRLKQVVYQLYYRLRNKFWRFRPVAQCKDGVNLNSNNYISNKDTYLGNKTFNFLNLQHQFDEIDWNFDSYGKLWTYNLNYFDYLNQSFIEESEALQLINDFITNNQTHKDAYEPYPTSLRIINWIKFLSKLSSNYNYDRKSIDKQIYNDSLRLLKNLEYHLLANHLLENGFALLFVAYYFQDEKFYAKAKQILKEQLQEQILSDGGHYELSPMYHQIILYRLLDTYQLVSSNKWKEDELITTLSSSASKMLSWLQAVTFKNGDIPMVNDAAKDIAPTTAQLVSYAADLFISSDTLPLSESGYRMYKRDGFELFCDIGQISPSYQPGHAHADNLNFILYYKEKPIIVDTGISTYEKNSRRHLERSTASHNTVTVNGQNSSDVWSGFRVGKRAVTHVVNETKQSVKAYHNGYRKYNIIHQREFFVKENSVTVIDEVLGNTNKSFIEGYIHFQPGLQLEKRGKSLLINKHLLLTFEHLDTFKIEDYLCSSGYNHLLKAQRMIYKIENNQISFEITSI